MKRVFVLLLPLCLVSSTYGQESGDAAVLDAMHSISSHDLLEYVKIQCDDKYQGRLTGTPEYQACAEWLAGEFEEWGIKPAGENGTWFQWFDVPYTLVGPDCGVALHIQVKKEGTILKRYKYIWNLCGINFRRREATAGSGLCRLWHYCP
jgi:hypothetical protein